MSGPLGAQKGSSMMDGGMLGVALECVERGWSVFPVGPDKRPWTRHGHKDASNDPVEIVRFNWDRANVGVATGWRSDVGVLDVDRHGGNGFETLERLRLTLPETLMSRTPREGRHVWFRHFEGSRSRRLGPALEWFSHGKFVVVPPAPRREWLNEGEIAEAPEELRRLVLTTTIHGQGGSFPAYLMSHNDGKSDGLPRSLYFTLCRLMPGKPKNRRFAGTILEKLIQLTEGRNNGLYSSTLGFKELIGRNAIEVSGACQLLLKATELNGYIAKDGIEAVRLTIMSGLGIKEWPEGV